MTREEIIDGLEIYTVGRLNKDRVHITVEELQKFIDEIKALEKETCEDAISRQAVLEYIEGSGAELGHSSENELVCQDIKELPPVAPQPKTGHWIYRTVRGEEVPCCSRCGLDNGTYYEFNFCPECGANMIEPQESEG